LQQALHTFILFHTFLIIHSPYALRWNIWCQKWKVLGCSWRKKSCLHHHYISSILCLKKGSPTLSIIAWTMMTRF